MFRVRTPGRPASIFVGATNDGRLIIPSTVANQAILPASGDAAIVRCQNAPGQYYFAARKANEMAVTNARRVQNWITNRDPINWIRSSSGDGQPPVIGSVYEANGMTWREVTFRPGPTGGGSVLQTGVALPSKAAVWSSIWLRTPPGAGQKTLLRLTASMSAQWPAAQRVNLALSETPKRFVTRTYGLETAIGVALVHGETLTDELTIWIAIDPDHCATADISPLGWSGTAYDYCAEVVAPDINYGFGAPGVRYFSYANPFTVDANGVVTDTGTRTPLPEVGVLAVPATTNRVYRSYSSDEGGWTLRAGTVWDSAFGNPLPGLPAPKACVPDGSNTFPGMNAVIQTITSGNPLTVYALFETQQGPGYFVFSVFSVFNNGQGFKFTRYDDGTRAENDIGVVFGRKIGVGPNGGNLWEVMLHGIIERNAYVVTLGPVWHRTDIRKGWVHYLEVRQGYPWQPSVLFVNRSDTAAASRAADFIPLGRRLGRTVDLYVRFDATNGLATGTLIGGSLGATAVSILRLVRQSDGTGQLHISDGYHTWQPALTVPQGQIVTITGQLGPTGGWINVNGTQEFTAQPFDFADITETYVGSTPEGDHCGLPLTVRIR